MRRIAVVVTARPSFARIRTVLDALGEYPVDVRLIMAGSTHLHHYGEVVKDCPFPIAHRVYSTLDGHNLRTTAAETGLLALYLSHIFAEDQPDCVVTIADRHETLATAMAASYQHIPLAHIQGGEKTGSIDDKVRDAVSMLADLHFPATYKAAQRLESMDVKGTIFTYGCPSVDIAASAVADPADAHTIVVLQHAVTNESADAERQIEETYQAVRTYANHYTIKWFWPGQDAGTEGMAKRLREHHEHADGGRVEFLRHLPADRFLSLLRGCACLVGNSSVGIRECSYLGTPVVDIGTRQEGREHGPNVVHSSHVYADIVAGIAVQLQHGRYASNPLYGDGSAGRRIAAALADPQAVAIAEALGCRPCA